MENPGRSHKSKENSQPPNKRRVLKVLLLVAGVLLVARLILPYVVLHFANKTLANIPGYYGHVEDIDIALIRGAYKMDSVFINKVDSTTQQQTEFFSSRSIDLSIEWKALLHGALAGEIILDHAVLRFTKDKSEPKEIEGDSSQLRVVLDKFMPIQINRFEVNQGIIEYQDSSVSPVVNLELTDAFVLAENLKSIYKTTDILPAKVIATANLYGGVFDLEMRLNPLSDKPTFDLNAELKNTDLPRLNQFFKAYGKFDVNQGNFGLYAEMATRENKFKGYVKPIIKDLDVVGPEDRNDGFLHKLWESTVGAIGVVFRNQKKDQVATKVPIEGELSNPKAGIVYALAEVVTNAFIQALVPAIDNEINLNSVGNQPVEKKSFFERLFDRKEKDNKKNKPGERA